MGLNDFIFNILDYCFQPGVSGERSALQIFGIKVMSRLAFYPSLLHNVIKEKTSGREWYDRIDANVILGALPFRGMVTDLKNKECVTGVVSLNKDYELWMFSLDGKGWARNDIKFLQLETRDNFEAPSQTKLKRGVDFIRASKGQGTTYVHCKAGRTRSATLVVCYLMEKNNWSPSEAISHVRKSRPQVFFASTQLQAIDIYYEKYVKLSSEVY